jgi:hypothetical protein
VPSSRATPTKPVGGWDASQLPASVPRDDRSDHLKAADDRDGDERRDETELDRRRTAAATQQPCIRLPHSIASTPTVERIIVDFFFLNRKYSEKPNNRFEFKLICNINKKCEVM